MINAETVHVKYWEELVRFGTEGRNKAFAHGVFERTRLREELARVGTTGLVVLSLNRERDHV